MRYINRRRFNDTLQCLNASSLQRTSAMLTYIILEDNSLAPKDLTDEENKALEILARCLKETELNRNKYKKLPADLRINKEYVNYIKEQKHSALSANIVLRRDILKYVIERVDKEIAHRTKPSEKTGYDIQVLTKQRALMLESRAKLKNIAKHVKQYHRPVRRDKVLLKIAVGALFAAAVVGLGVVAAGLMFGTLALGTGLLVYAPPVLGVSALFTAVMALPAVPVAPLAGIVVAIDNAESICNTSYEFLEKKVLTHKTKSLARTTSKLLEKQDNKIASKSLSLEPLQAKMIKTVTTGKFGFLAHRPGKPRRAHQQLEPQVLPAFGRV